MKDFPGVPQLLRKNAGMSYRCGIRTLLLEIKSIYTLHKPSNTSLPEPITEVEDIGYIFFIMAQQPPVGQGLLIVEDS